jgi:hypothetical protein
MIIRYIIFVVRDVKEFLKESPINITKSDFGSNLNY